MEFALLLILAASMAVSFLLSGMESGVLALSRLRIRQRLRAGQRRARLLHGYLEHPENFLWTILVGNTLANLLIVSITVFALYRWLKQVPLLFIAALLASGLLFYAFCELLPKTLFRLYPNRLCLLLAPPFRGVHLGLRPLVWLMTWVSDHLLRWTGGKRFTGHLFGNREELRLVMMESAEALTAEERAMINRVLDLPGITVGQIAIPMSKVISVAADAPVSAVLALARECGYSRLPVWERRNGSKRIVGILHLDVLLYEAELDPDRPAGRVMRPALCLDRHLRLESALRQMQRASQRLALVVGPDQTECGIVSVQDLLQVIFGEISL